MMTGSQISPLAWVLLITLGVIWGGSFYWAEVALNALGPFTIVAFRLALGAVFLWVVIMVQGLRLPRRAADWGRLFVMGLLNNALPFSLIVWGQQFIEGGLASILNATTALFGAVVAGLLLTDERLSAHKIAGALIGIWGIGVAMGGEAFRALDPRSLGQLAILAAALCYSFAGVWAKTQLRAFSPALSAFGMVVTGALIMIVVAITREGWPSFDYAPAVWRALIGISFLATGCAYLLYFKILELAGSANLMLVTLLVPPSAIALGWFYLNEEIGYEAWIGFAIIALGLSVTDGRLLKLFRGRR